MPDPRRHAAALLAVLLLAAPASALAEPTLLAQIEDAAPTPQPQPPLSEEPPQALDGGDEGSGEEEPGPAPAPDGDDPPLPETGLDAGLVALLGLGLLASGSGLRLTLRGEDAV